MGMANKGRHRQAESRETENREVDGARNAPSRRVR